MTYFQLRRDCFIRVYGGFGYIVNKSTFSDKIVDEAGAVFLQALSREPQSLDALAQKVASSFVGADLAQVKGDAAEFYADLEKSGYLVSGSSVEDAAAKDGGFDYSTLAGKIDNLKKHDLPTGKSTQEVLEEICLKNKQLVSLQVEITNKCNERCVHCYIPHELKNTNLDDATFFKILDDAKKMNVLDVTLSGGEPMAHPHFAEFFKKAKSMGFSVNITTNLTLLTDEIIEIFKDGALSSANVSVYSMDAKIHDAITNLPGSLEKTTANIMRLVKNNIPVQINCPIMVQNQDSFGDVVEWGEANKISVRCDYGIMACSDHSTKNLGNRLADENLYKVIRTLCEKNGVIKTRMTSKKFAEVFANPRDISEERMCGVGASFICIDALGNVHPCPGWERYVGGSVREKSLKEIWENSPEIEYLRGLRRKDFPKCLTCDDRDFCAFCMARNANEDPNGDIFNVQPYFCEMARINRKVAQDLASGK